MLKLVDIRKSYHTAGFTQTALNGVSISFRDNEFTAILGPSGSGKTTLLNIIGGLDHYDAGELIIDSVYTKRYEDRDWDTYRNNRIGYVFQSYNLIPHQTILSNVELALTLSGVSPAERKARATQTLAKLGLEDHLHKLPSQLSGGQMQRVAIARALINDPEILLADEPTGALDTNTGIQVMDLLSEISKDRLVILVTHNQELAETYANRIIHLKDGSIASDSRPYYPEIMGQRTASEPRTSKMSFLTAISLSFSNLLSKIGRTFMTALAGSIGIIGIAAILALATGVNNYIRDVERDTMNIYPLTIQERGFDLASLFSDPGERLRDTEREEDSVPVLNVVETMFSYQNKNDLGSLKEYIESHKNDLEPNVKTIQYKYNITPQIYLPDHSEETQQVNPDAILSTRGMGGDSGFGSLAGSFGFSTMGLFHEMSGDETMFADQFDLMAGTWPDRYDEAILVLSPGGAISDYLLYGMALRDRTQLESMIDSIIENEDKQVKVNDERVGSVSYEELLAVEFQVIAAADRYAYDEQYDVWIDKSTDKNFMRSLIDDGLTLKISGIVQPKEDETATSLMIGINYRPELIRYLMEETAQSEIVKEQLADPLTNVMTGERFGEDAQNAQNGSFQFTDLIQVDPDAMSGAIQFDPSKLDLSSMNLKDLSFPTGELDLSSMDFSGIDLSGMDISGFEMPNLDLAALDFTGIDLTAIDLSGIDLSSLDFTSIDVSGIPLPEFDLSNFTLPEFSPSETQLPDVDITSMQPSESDLLALTDSISAAIHVQSGELQALVGTLMTGFLSEESEAQVTDPQQMTADIVSYLKKPEIQAMIDSWHQALIQPGSMQEPIRNAVDVYLQDVMQEYTDRIAQGFQFLTEESMTAYLKQLSSAFSEQLQAQMTDYASQVATYLQSGILSQVQSQILSQLQTQLMPQLQTQLMSQLQRQLMSQVQTQLFSQLETQLMSQLQSQLMTQLQSQLTNQLGSQLMPQLQSGIESAMTQMMSDLPAQMQDAITIDPDAFSQAFQMSMSEEETLSLMTAMMNPQVSSLERNLSALGYADPQIPSQIDIYPVDFQAKENIDTFLQSYNAQMEEENQPDKVVRYTDIVGTMMRSVSDIINMISNILIAFVAISLVVSSIMIGVITYISVLERKKEIGILRALGASKKDIRRVFNAETLILGFVAGVLGILVTFLLTFPANAIVYQKFGVERIAQLPLQASLILIGVSMALAFLSGLIPSSAAARKDPVEALRSE